MTRKVLCVIKSEILVRGNTPQGTQLHFPCPARSGSNFFKTNHTVQILGDRPMTIPLLKHTAQRQKLALIFSTRKMLAFRRSTSLGHMVDVNADVNHMLYFVLAT